MVDSGLLVADSNGVIVGVAVERFELVWMMRYPSLWAVFGLASVLCLGLGCRCWYSNAVSGCGLGLFVDSGLWGWGVGYHGLVLWFA